MSLPQMQKEEKINCLNDEGKKRLEEERKKNPLTIKCFDCKRVESWHQEHYIK